MAERGFKLVATCCSGANGLSANLPLSTQMNSSGQSVSLVFFHTKPSTRNVSLILIAEPSNLKLQSPSLSLSLKAQNLKPKPYSLILKA